MNLKTCIILLFLSLQLGVYSQVSDTIGIQRLFRLHNQWNYNPAFASANGKHVLNTRLDYFSFASNSQSIDQFRIEYQTSIRKHHGLMLQYDVSDNDNYKLETFGIGYSVNIRQGKKFLSAGIGYRYAKPTLDFNKFSFFDQISYANGFVMQTQEFGPPSTPYNLFDLGLNFSHPRYYVSASILGFNEPNNAFYEVVGSPKVYRSITQLNIGIHLLNYKNHAITLVADYVRQIQNNLFLTGINIAYQQKYFVCYQRNFIPGQLFENSQLFELGFYHSNFRSSIRYRYVSELDETFFRSGTWSLNIAISPFKN